MIQDNQVIYWWWQKCRNSLGKISPPQYKTRACAVKHHWMWIHDSAVENSRIVFSFISSYFIYFHFTVSPNPSCNGVVRCEDNCDIMTINSQLVTETMRHHSTRFLLCSWAQLWRTNNKRPMSLSPHNQEKISGVTCSYHVKCCWILLFTKIVGL